MPQLAILHAHSTFYLQLACYIIFGLDHIIDFELIWCRGVLWCHKEQISYLWPESGKNQEIYGLSLEGIVIFSTYNKFNTVFSKVHSITLNFLPFLQGRCNRLGGAIKKE